MSGRSLATYARTFPTPTKSDYKGSGPQMIRSDGKLRGDLLDYATERTPTGESTGGQLNPNFVEWMMGWPYEYTRIDKRWTPFSREEITGECLRTLWDDERFTGSPQGQEFIEQLAREHPDIVRELSYGSALGRGQASVASLSTVLRGLWEACHSWPLRNAQEPFQAAWECASSETKGWVAMASIRGIWHAEWPGVPRLETGITARVDRIKAIGNGQVPRVAATAFNILRGE